MTHIVKLSCSKGKESTEISAMFSRSNHKGVTLLQYHGCQSTTRSIQAVMHWQDLNTTHSVLQTHFRHIQCVDDTVQGRWHNVTRKIPEPEETYVDNVFQEEARLGFVCAWYQRSHHYCTDGYGIFFTAKSSQPSSLTCYATLKARVLHWSVEVLNVQWTHHTNTKQFFVQHWEIFATSVLTKLQTKIYFLWFWRFSRTVIIDRFTGHFAIVLSIYHILYFYMSSWLRLSFYCWHMMLLAFSEMKW